MKLDNIKEIVMDKICLYTIDNMEDIWEGHIKNMPSKYLNLEIKIIGAKRKGIVDIGVSLSASKTYELVAAGIQAAVN